MEDNGNCSSDGAINNATSGVVFPPWLLVLLVSFALVGFLSNILVIVTILKSRFLHDVTHYLILNLAVSDGLCCFMFGLEMIMDLFNYPNDNTSQIAEILYCRLIYGHYLFQSFAYISAYNLVIISLERYIGIVKPLRYHQFCKTSNMRCAVCLAWTLGFCAYSLHLFGLIYDPLEATLEERCRLFHHWLWHFVPFVGGFVVPLLTMMWAYSRIIRALKESALNQQVSLQARETQGATRRVVHLMLLVTIGYVILYIPTQPAYMIIVTIKLGYFELTPLGMLLTDLIIKLPVLLNSFINPFIYAFKYKKFRKGLRQSLCGQRTNSLEPGDQLHMNETRVPTMPNNMDI